VQLLCAWCVNGTNTTNGVCLAVEACTSNSTTAYYVCPITINYIPEVCPDQCSGHGICINSTQPGYADAVKQQAAFVANLKANSSLCLCFPGYSGINCGQVPEPDNTVVIAASIGTAAVVGIIVAILVALFLAGGGGAYAYAQTGGAATPAPVFNNPIYADSGNKGQNPLFRVG